MSPNPGVLCEPPPSLETEPERASTTIPLVLIQVPSLPTGPRVPRPSVRPLGPVRRRRRLRREVRVAALALLFSVPMVGISLKFWPSGSSTEASIPMLVASMPPVSDLGQNAEDSPIRSWVTISLEPAAGNRVPEFQPPVVRPAGFLLPDHGSEEPAHAGG